MLRFNVVATKIVFIPHLLILSQSGILNTGFLACASLPWTICIHLSYDNIQWTS